MTKLYFMLDRVNTLRLMFESTMTGDFPPSSKRTGVRCFAAAAITIRPTLPLPTTGDEDGKKITFTRLSWFICLIYYILKVSHEKISQANSIIERLELTCVTNFVPLLFQQRSGFSHRPLNDPHGRVIQVFIHQLSK